MTKVKFKNHSTPKGQIMLKFLCSALVVFSTGSLCANIHPAPGSFGVTGEYLYLLPTFDDTYFVTKSGATSTFPTGERHHNDFNFNSGYRITGVYAFCGCECPRELIVSWAQLDAKQSKTVSGSFLWGTLGRADFASSFENYAGTAKSTLKADYDRLDGFFSQQVYNCCDLDIRLLGGFEYADLQLKEKYTYVNGQTVGTIHQKAKTWGIGPELGASFNYQICQFTDCLPGTLSLNVVTTGSLLVSESKTKDNNVLAGADVLSVHDEKTWRVVPALHTRVGLNYDTCVCAYDTSVEVGYEFNSYYRGQARTVYPDDVADGLCQTQYYNFDVQGMYVAVSVGF